MRRKHTHISVVAGLTLTLLFSSVVLAVGNDKAKKRTKSVNTIVLHAIGGPYCKDSKVVFSGSGGDAQKWKKYFEKEKDISIHYIVDRTGTVAASIDEDRIAWHAKGRNARSIGIELTNNGDGVEEYPEVQIAALKKLVNEIKSRHSDVTNQNIIKHSDIDKRTFECAGKDEKLKRDPGPQFPYDDFIENL